jgi:hypothetical protein
MLRRLNDGAPVARVLPSTAVSKGPAPLDLAAFRGRLDLDRIAVAGARATFSPWPASCSVPCSHVRRLVDAPPPPPPAGRGGGGGGGGGGRRGGGGGGGGGGGAGGGCCVPRPPAGGGWGAAPPPPPPPACPVWVDGCMESPGHSFGAATAVGASADPRSTFRCVLALDAWLFPVSRLFDGEPCTRWGAVARPTSTAHPCNLGGAMADSADVPGPVCQLRDVPLEREFGGHSSLGRRRPRRQPWYARCKDGTRQAVAHDAVRVDRQGAGPTAWWSRSYRPRTRTRATFPCSCQTCSGSLAWPARCTHPPPSISTIAPCSRFSTGICPRAWCVVTRATERFRTRSLPSPRVG